MFIEVTTKSNGRKRLLNLHHIVDIIPLEDIAGKSTGTHINHTRLPSDGCIVVEESYSEIKTTIERITGFLVVKGTL